MWCLMDVDLLDDRDGGMVGPAGIHEMVGMVGLRDPWDGWDGKDCQNRRMIGWVGIVR